LENIGNFLTKWSCSCPERLRDIRVVVLEDFHITPLNGWSCCGERMTSTQDVEKYLRKRLPSHMDAAVRLIHTYDQWTTNSGIHMRVGSGLTLKHFYDAIAFTNDKLLEASDRANHALGS